MKNKEISLFQERLVGLYLRLNGYFQSGYIPHSKIWGKEGTDFDRVAIRFPKHKQPERDIDSSEILNIPKNSIDIVIAEVKNKIDYFNDTLSLEEKNAKENWRQLLNWIGLFDDDKITELIPELIELAKQNGNKKIEFIRFKSRHYGLITIRPILFIIEKKKNADEENIFWINGEEILNYIWDCFCPQKKRNECSTRYNFTLWGNEYSDIVDYIKDRDKVHKGIGTLDEMYNALIK